MIDHSNPLRLIVYWAGGLAIAGRKPVDAESTVNLSGVKVVVVDDNEPMCRALVLVLEGAGCDVVAAPDGFTALARIADHRPDIVFLDVTLPRLDGFQVCAILKQNQKFSAIPVIMFSAIASLSERARARVVGADFFLPKPLSREEIQAVIDRFVSPTGFSKNMLSAHGG